MARCETKEMQSPLFVDASRQTQPVDYSVKGVQSYMANQISSGVQVTVKDSGHSHSGNLVTMNKGDSRNIAAISQWIKEEPVDEDELSQAAYDFVITQLWPNNIGTEGCTTQPESCATERKIWRIRETNSGNKGQEYIKNTKNSGKMLSSGDISTQCGQMQSESECDITPEVLVRVLGKSSELAATLPELRRLCLQSSSVMEIVRRYPYIFHFQDDTVRLRPDIKICKAYCGPKGCENRKSCPDLHICRNYTIDECHDSECVLGHSWNTGHNLYVLKTFCLDTLRPDVLQMFVKDRICTSEDEYINVCRPYNNGGCSNLPCLSLHICLPFLVGLMKGNSICYEDCPLNHDFTHRSCITVLEKYGISTNESKRDIALDIQQSNPAICYEETQNSYFENNISLQLIDIGKQSSECSDHSYSSRGTKRKRNSSCFNSEKTEKSLAKSPQTVWSHDLKGMVPIPEICYFSVVNTCNFESHGCQRLHSVLHFHWQVSEQGGEWLNQRPDQVKCLERAYCDPSKNAVTLPRLDPASLDHSVRGLFTLMGRDSWFSDFYTMTLTNSSASKVLYIRRLCSEKLDGVEIISSKYVWYFLDNNNVWIQYGKPDSAGNNSLTSSVTSEQIEELYQKNPVATIQFSNSQFTYDLNFQLMLQVNLGTKKTRQVMRRPQPHLQDEGLEDLPPNWSVMLPKQRVQRCPLLGTSPEYKAVLDHLSRNPASNFKWMSIERIQNPYLWKAFENKKKEMTALYGSSLAVDVRYLFHGTSYDKVKNICEENFDWRLHGLANGQVFGRGTYFATDYNYACNYARPDANGYRYLFVASVAVGTKTLGNAVMQRPPINSATSLPFDSTVNNMINPTIIVKYDKQEYYPEYLVIFC